MENSFEPAVKFLTDYEKQIEQNRIMKPIQDIVRVYGAGGCQLFELFNTFKVLHGRNLEKSVVADAIRYGFVQEIPYRGRLKVDKALLKSKKKTLFDLLSSD